MGRIIAWVLAVLFFIAVTEGLPDTRRARLIHKQTVTVFLMSNDYMSIAAQKKLFIGAAEQIRNEVGILITPQFLRLFIDKCGWFPSDSWGITNLTRLDCLDNWLPKKHRMRYVVSPPYEKDGLGHFFGAAIGKCKKTGIAYCNAADFWWLGRGKRWRLSRVGIEHELGHLFGASHEDSYSMMNFSALRLAENGLSWSPMSIEAIRQCVRGW